MAEWLNNPIIITALIALVGGILYVGRWTGKVDTDRENFKKFMNEIRGDIKQILDRLPPVAVAKGNSPVTLTELGRKISKEIRGRDWAVNTADKIKESVQDKTAYEIQEYCKEFVKLRHTFSKEQDTLMKNSAYENGIKRDQVLNVLAIELRDRLLEIT